MSDTIIVSPEEANKNPSFVVPHETLNQHVDSASELVDTESKIVTLLEKLQRLPVTPPSLYIDLEGIILSRHGCISILQIFILPLDKTYLVDVLGLQEKAFLEKDCHSGQNLQSVLESPNIPKVFFDVRNKSDALFSHFKIKLAGVIDLQLMQLATSTFTRKYVRGLETCIEKDAGCDHRIWRSSKEKWLKLCDPERGGSHDVIMARPLSEDINDYCVQRVRCLSSLWIEYTKYISPAWSQKVTAETLARVERSQTAAYDESGERGKLISAGWYRT
ncbi:hypothetical protein N7488_007168 [Penicillium malachiteum]|nr:hypothetical protein N7488_007168 [Penicillium malachiteum]